MANAPRAKQHHFLPVSFLAGFSASGTRRARLFAFDKHTRKQYPTTPEKAGRAGSFYAIEDSDNPNAIEEALGPIDTAGSRCIRDIIKNTHLPNDRSTLFAFMARLVTGNPKQWRFQNQFGDFLKNYMQIVAMQPEFKSILTALEKAQPDWGPIDYEYMKKWTLDGNYDVVMPQNAFLQSMLASMPLVESLLAKRNWQLIHCSDSDLVIGDDPVMLVPIEDEGWNPMRGIGFLTLRSAVVFPISCRFLLCGTFVENLSPYVILPKDVVAQVNLISIAYAQRFVYSADSDFIWMKDDKSIGGLRECVELFENWVPDEPERRRGGKAGIGRKPQ